jgi:hypothetical protein
VMQTMGTESIMAVAMPVTRLVAPGPGGGDGDADLAGGARVSVGGVRCALLVADQDVADRVLAQSVVDGQDGAAGIAEHVANALAFEGGPDDLGAGEARGLGGGGCRCFAHCGFLHGAAPMRFLVGVRCCVGTALPGCRGDVGAVVKQVNGFN